MIFTPKIYKAVNFAAQAHDGQLRKNTGTPYISHPFSVALICSEFTRDEATLIGALFHDVVEDVNNPEYSANIIEENFGSEVVTIVLECSEDKSITNKKRRKELYLRKMEQASQKSLMIMCADRIHNMMSLVHDSEAVDVWKTFDRKEYTQYFEDSLVNFEKYFKNEFMIDVFKEKLQKLKDLN